MKKKNVLNLIKYHTEKNETQFRNEAIEIARYFDSIGDNQLSEYIISLISDANLFMPQTNDFKSDFLTKVDFDNTSLPLPKSIMEDIKGMINAINHNVGVNKFLFEGSPGTGKTETVKQLARLLNRKLFMVEFSALIDSKLGQTAKNVVSVFNDIKRIPNPHGVIILLDEIDAIALDRVNSNDLREMGRVTSTILKELDNFSDEIVLIATTNLFDNFDKALIRRFDAIINFNRYTRDDLIEVAETILSTFLRKFKYAGRDMRLFKKIINQMDVIPYPGELENIIKTSLAFSDPSNEYDYFKKLFRDVFPKYEIMSLLEIYEKGFTLREMEILTNISKSQISRDLKGASNE